MLRDNVAVIIMHGWRSSHIMRCLLNTFVDFPLIDRQINAIRMLHTIIKYTFLKIWWSATLSSFQYTSVSRRNVFSANDAKQPLISTNNWRNPKHSRIWRTKLTLLINNSGFAAVNYVEIQLVLRVRSKSRLSYTCFTLIGQGKLRFWSHLLVTWLCRTKGRWEESLTVTHPHPHPPLSRRIWDVWNVKVASILTNNSKPISSFMPLACSSSRSFGSAERITIELIFFEFREKKIRKESSS